jgi:hypothetical protein
MLLVVLSLGRPILEVIAPRLYILLEEVVFSLTTRLPLFFLVQNLYTANIATTTLANPPRAPPIAAAVFTPLGTVEAGDEVD